MDPRAAIAAALRRSRRVLLVTHVDPDGDTLGSTLALALALEAAGHRVTVGSDGGVPPVFAFLPGAGRVVQAPPDERFDVALAMECSTLARCGRFAGLVERTALVATIDHHEDAAPFGHLNHIDPTAAAVAELTADLIRDLGAPWTPAIATALLTALVTDTGAFRFPTVRPRTLRLAADLMDAGASLADVVARVYENRPERAMRLLGLVLTGLMRAAGGRVAYGTVSAAMRAATGTGPEDTAGFVALLREIEGVRVAILFEEAADGIHVSIRARDGVRANAIAAAFGGGGHPGAAGCTLAPPLEDAPARLLPAVEAELWTAS